jgi:hypothetical protein
METAIKTVKKLASELVGDGKSPNKYFVTIGYGWYMTEGEESEGEQMKDSLDCATIFLEDEESANVVFDAIPINKDVTKVTKYTIGQVTIEDRKTGTIREKYLFKSKSGHFLLKVN